MMEVNSIGTTQTNQRMDYVMDYVMLMAGLALLVTCTIGVVDGDITSKVIFRLIPLSASLVLLLNSLSNLDVI